jgi:tetratricopeptide (TPR) repeat protein
MPGPQENTPLPASERMKEVALLLKQADKLVKEGDLATALQLIAKARSYDSRHLYALAYEERVRTLLNAKQAEEAKKASAPASAAPSLTSSSAAPEPTAEQKIAPSLQHLSNLAIIEAQHSAAVAAQQEQAVELHKKEEEAKSKNDEMRRTAIEGKIAAFLTRANGYYQRKEYSRALDEIARAYLLDPVNDRIHALEDTIRKAQEDSRRDEETERQRKMEEDRQKRQELLKNQSQLYQKEKEEKVKREERERKRAQEEKVKQYLQHVTELYQANKLDEALSELAFVIVIDPLNEEVLRLEQRILEMQERQQQQQLEQYQRQLEERQRKRETIVATIRKHIANAEQLARQQKFTDALRTITRATVLDPINDELQECERRILAMQEEHFRHEEESKRELQDQIRRQQEEEIRRMVHTDRERVLEGESEEVLARRRADKEKITHYLERAAKFLSERQFEVALGEVALAFIIDPFDEDVKGMEQRILAEREAYQAAHQEKLQQSLKDEERSRNEADAKISMHLAEAERLRSMKQFSKAFNEVAKAFILNPLDLTIQSFEQQLQAEFDEFLAEEHERRTKDQSDKVIERHLQHAAEFLERDLFEQALSEVNSGLAVDEQHPELLALCQRIQDASDQWKVLQRVESRNLEIQKLLVVAREYLTVEKFDEALIAVRKALDFDPTRVESIALMEDIEAVMAQTLDQKRSEAREVKVNRYLSQAQSYLMANVLDKALVEILSGLVLDPANDELLKLEQRITALHEAKLSSQQAAPAGVPQPRISKEEQDRLIRIHIRVATEFRSQHEYAKALDEIAHGLTVDMQNAELLTLDTEIRAEQADHDLKAAQGLKLIYSSGQAAG